MYQLDTYFAFFRNGRCYGIDPRQHGSGARDWNERMKRNYALADEIRELPQAEAEAAYHAGARHV